MVLRFKYFEKYSDINPGRIVGQSGKLEESLVDIGDEGICKRLQATVIRGRYNRK
jgi:hypothetical protein